MRDHQRRQFSQDELRLLSQALNEILNGPEAIEDWEFRTRVGATREDALGLLRRLQRELAEASDSAS